MVLPVLPSKRALYVDHEALGLILLSFFCLDIEVLGCAEQAPSEHLWDIVQGRT